MPGSADLMAGVSALNRAAPGYVKADDYATGVIPERFASERIRQLLKGSGDAYRFRLARKPITSLINRVGVGSITSSKGDQVSAVIEQIRRANKMPEQEPYLIERAATYGDAYWLISEVDPDDPYATPDLREAGVEITYHSPLHTRAMYESTDGRRCLYVIRRWQEASALGAQWRAELIYPDRLERWTCEPGASGETPETWSLDGQPEPNESGEIPFVHMRTGLPYGRPQHIDAYGPQDAITKAIVTQVEVDLESHGFPERIRITDDKAVQDTARDTVNWADDTDAQRVDRQVSGRRSGPGTEQVYTGTKSVQHVDPPDPSILIPVIDQWIRLLSVATDTPAWEFDPSTGMQMSGVARWRAEAPLRAREATFKRYLLEFLRQAYGLALSLRGLDAGDLDVEWVPPEVQADPDWWTVASARRDHGVPQEQILTEAGYTPEQVRDFLDTDADERFFGERVRLLSDLSEALERLSGPVSLGIIDAGRVAALVDRIMSEAGESPIGGDGESEVAAVSTLPDGRDPRDVANADTRP